MSEQEIRANDLVQYVGPDPDMYATYGRVHTVHTFGLSGPVADTLFDGQTGMDAVPVKFLHKVPANTAPDAPQDHGPLAAPLSDRTLAKVLSRPAYVPRPVRPTTAEAVEAIKKRLSWASIHWGTESVSDDAWPHIADAVLALWDAEVQP